MNKKSIIITPSSEISKPMATLSVTVPMLDLSPKQFSGAFRHWRKDAITARQTNYLKHFGVFVTQADFQMFNKGNASDVLDALTSRKDQHARLQYHLAQASRLLEASRF